MEDNNNNNGEETATIDTGGGALMAEDNVNEEEDVDSMVTWLFSMDDYEEEEDETELWKVLEASSAEKPFETKVKIIEDPPRWHPLVFQTAAAYVTINGNEESCGSSFSDSDTSYMAGISSCCGCGFMAVEVGDGGGAWDCVKEEVARGWMESESGDGGALDGVAEDVAARGWEEWLVSSGGGGGGYCDDEMLERFLGGGGGRFEIEERR